MGAMGSVMVERGGTTVEDSVRNKRPTYRFHRFPQPSASAPTDAEEGSKKLAPECDI
jgi:hypothetical protein